MYTYMSWRVIRDMRNRQLVSSYEVIRQAYRYIARNEENPIKLRYQAQLALNSIPRPARLAAIKNRCVESGRGRGIFRAFRMCRTQFRNKALNGDLPGVIKAQW
ncbi:40S ribosomal protein mrp2, mitochondrial [Entomophthora muscae]|uniref:40S ribosomal protein mrp2, mitochondrial n=2 Tax=Entomophthora muscae TaxID=34485 RepID=A0ACC2T757_9FUNG|nr:40S ribosomal protein mrp2, mitochondrial [Entomophthora muscae]KAJ9080159.1 40S ribosomal protein mrp2, mitochondrial [Entomophthora muscae]